jgi:T-complex protein 1 subunit beta
MLAWVCHFPLCTGSRTRTNEMFRIDMEQGTIGSMKDLGITESYKLKRQVLISASEAAEMILRVDTILRATPRKREAV